jgi:hypothetical protein
MAVKEGYILIDSADVGAVLRAASLASKEQAGVPMLLAITFEYALLMQDADPQEALQVREVTLAEARKQARVFWDKAHPPALGVVR